MPQSVARPPRQDERHREREIERERERAANKNINHSPLVKEERKILANWTTRLRDERESETEIGRDGEEAR